MSADVQLAGPLTFSKDGMHLPYKVTAFNHGTSPATYLRIVSHIWSGYIESTGTNQIEKRICPDHKFMYAGATVFPKEPFTEGFDIAVPVSEIHTTGNYFFPEVVGCVEYAIETAPSQTKRTFFMYNIYRKGDVIHPGEIVTLDQLSIMKGDWIGFNAY